MKKLNKIELRQKALNKKEYQEILNKYYKWKEQQNKESIVKNATKKLIKE